MGELSLSDFDKVLKDVYQGPVRAQMRTSTVLLNRVKRVTDRIDQSGRQALIPINLRLSQSIGARADGSPLPSAAETIYREEKVPLRHIYAAIAVSGQTIRASRNNAGAFVRAVDSEMDNIATSLKLDINRQLFGDGTGALTTVTVDAATDATSLTVADLRYLKVGMKVDIYESSSKKYDSVTITALSADDGAGTVTIAAHTDSALTATNTPTIYREDSKGIEVMGLKGIIDDATYVDTLHNIQGSVDIEWKSKAYGNSGTPRALTLALMQSPFTYMEKTAGGPSALITTFGVRDKYVDLLVADKRHVNTMKLDGGFTAVEYNGKPIIPDSDAIKNTIFYMADQFFAMYYAAELDWLAEDGSILHKVSGYDKYEAEMVWDLEMATSRRNANAVLRDITE